MRRYALLSAAVAVGVPAVMYAGQVNLQDTTPGVPQAGHLNITGTAIAGSVVGYSNTPTGIAYGGDFRSVSTSGRGVLGNASATTGVTYGGLFQSFSNQGRGIAGITSSLSGPTVGGFFTTNSVNGKGVQGSSNATSGLNYGVYGRNVSPAGFAIYGEGHGAFTGNLGLGTGTTPVGDRLVVNGNASISGTVSGNGSGLTNLNASALASGSVSDSLLSGNIARRDVSNDFVGKNSFTSNAGFGRVIEVISTADGMSGVRAIISGGSAIGLNSNATGTNSIGVRASGQSGGEFYGTQAVYAQGSARGVYGQAADADGIGVQGTAVGAGPSKGVYGRNASASGTSFGVYGQTSSPTGFGVFSEGHVGVTGNLGIGTGTTAPQNRLQIVDDNSATQGSLKVSNGSPSTSFLDLRTGIASYAGGTLANIGVAALAQSTDGSASYGVYGYAVGTGANYGIYGAADSGSLNWAGYFDGGLFAITASAGVKAFLIDHPLDPANKYLRHSSIESDERMNLYRGLVVTDNRGYATVTLPTWSDALNKDYLYQLTVIDDADSDSFTLAKVVQQVRNGMFKIRTSAPNTKVSWQISGVRHDPTSEYMPLEVEENKQGSARGKYLVPQAYGKDASFAIVQRPQAAVVKGRK